MEQRGRADHPDRRYVLRSTLMAWLVCPLLTVIGGVPAELILLLFDRESTTVFLAVALAFPTLPWIISAVRGRALPERPLVRYGPVVGAFAYYMLVWVIFFGASGYLLSELNRLFYWLTAPFFSLSSMSSISPIISPCP